MNELIPYDSAAPEGPHSPLFHLESERSVLGAMLRTKEAALTAIESLQPADFYDPANREVFAAMRDIAASSRPIDLVTLDEELTKRGKLDAIGGAAYLVELTRSVPSSVNIRAYIEIVDEKATLRRLIDACEQIGQACRAGEKETPDILADAERRIYDITMRKGCEELTHIEPILLNTFGYIETLAMNNGQVNGVPTGYADLDDMLTGLHSGELILIAGRPSMGKTSLGMNIIENATIRAGKTAAVFSLEMPALQLALRMICTEGRVDMQRVRRGQITEEEWGRISDALTVIAKAQIYVDASPGATVAEISRKAKRMQLEHGLDVVLIDYLSLMSADGKYGSRQEEVSSISRSLKRMAIDLNVPVVVLQQLSRAPTGRANHRPVLSDIRESGAIEQDADVVMFIHREEYYDPDTADKGIAELIVAKQRNGALGTVRLGWRGEYTWFIDRSHNPKEAVQQEGGTQDETDRGTK